MYYFVCYSSLLKRNRPQRLSGIFMVLLTVAAVASLTTRLQQARRRALIRALERLEHSQAVGSDAGLGPHPLGDGHLRYQRLLRLGVNRVTLLARADGEMKVAMKVAVKVATRRW